MKRQRHTRQRQLILDAVNARRDHPSADDIYMDVRAVDDKISRGTVYRNLRILVKNGEIHQVKFLNSDRYEARLDNHYHITCSRCGKVGDVPMLYKGEIDRQVSEETGYSISGHRVVFEGICPDCQKSAANIGQ